MVVLMSRPWRIRFGGAKYHVTVRGNNRQCVFHADADYLRFLAQLSDCLEKDRVILYAYVLMPNHFHLFVETPGGNLSRFMQRLNTAYRCRGTRREGPKRSPWSRPAVTAARVSAGSANTSVIRATGQSTSSDSACANFLPMIASRARNWISCRKRSPKAIFYIRGLTLQSTAKQDRENLKIGGPQVPVAFREG